MELRSSPPAERVPAEGRTLPPPLARRDRRAVWRPPTPLKEAGWSGRCPWAARQEARNSSQARVHRPTSQWWRPRRLLAPWKRASPPSSLTVAASEARRRRPPETAARATTSQSPNVSAMPASFSNCAIEAHCRCGAAAVRARCLSIASTTSQSPRRTNGCSSHPTFSKSRTAERSFRQGPEEVSVRAEVRSRCSRTQRISRSGCLSASESKRRSA